MANILPPDLASRTSAELLEACGRLQEAYTAALEREAAAAATARQRLTAAAPRPRTTPRHPGRARHTYTDPHPKGWGSFRVSRYGSGTTRPTPCGVYPCQGVPGTARQDAT